MTVIPNFWEKCVYLLLHMCVDQYNISPHIKLACLKKSLVKKKKKKDIAMLRYFKAVGYNNSFKID